MQTVCFFFLNKFITERLKIVKKSMQSTKNKTFFSTCHPYSHPYISLLSSQLVAVSCFFFLAVKCLKSNHHLRPAAPVIMTVQPSVTHSTVRVQGVLQAVRRRGTGEKDERMRGINLRKNKTQKRKKPEVTEVKMYFLSMTV